MKFIKYFLLSFFIISTISTIFSIDAVSKPSMGFGYLANNSKDKNYDYLETIFPNSFANSMRNIFDIDVEKPHSINEILKEKKLKLKKKYNPAELAETIKIIGTDIFIYGNFSLLPNEKIKIVLHYYTKGKNELFTFTNIGKMETEIFKLVDRISEILINYLSDEKIYKTESIPVKSRIAILTNAKGRYLNRLYFSFLEKGYNLSGFQGNTLYNIITDKSIKSLKFISTKNNSYDLITDTKAIKFYYGTWAGEKYYKKLNNLKKIIKLYNNNYNNSKENILKKISKIYKNTIDYILIIGFNKDMNRAFVRCINARKKNLIWIQRKIEGDSLAEISDKIVNNLSTLPKSIINEK